MKQYNTTAVNKPNYNMNIKKYPNSHFCWIDCDAYFPERQHAVRIKMTSTAK